MRRDFDFALLIGGLLGFVIACLLIFLPFVGVSDFVYRWQTLIAGLIAIVAAAVALWAVRQQTLHTQEMENERHRREDERRKRREYAARKMLPHALASICGYAQGCIDALRQAADDGRFPERDDVNLDLSRLTAPTLSDLNIEPVKQLLEFGDRDIQDRLSNLVQCLQIQQSRLAQRDSVSVNWLYGLVADAVEVHARAHSLFVYARNDGAPAPGPIKRWDLHNSEGVCGLNPPERQRLHYTVDEDLA